MATGRLLGIVLALALVTEGCASVERRTLAARFIRQGTPAVDLGGPRPAAMRPVDRQALLRATADAPPPPKAVGSLETSDPRLRAALLRLAAAPHPVNFLGVADEYLRLGVNDRALDYLNRSIATHGGDADTYDAIARVWRNWHQPGEALGPAHRAVFLAPRSPIVHNTLGTVLYRLGQVDAARASFDRALELNPNAWYALANLCHINMQAGNTRAAIEQCRRAAVLRKHAPRG